MKIKTTEQLHSRILWFQPSNFLRCEINQCECNSRQLHSWTQKVNSTGNQASPYMTGHLSHNDQSQSSNNPTSEICLPGKAPTRINETTTKRVGSGSDDRPSKYTVIKVGFQYLHCQKDPAWTCTIPLLPQYMVLWSLCGHDRNAWSWQFRNRSPD